MAAGRRMALQRIADRERDSWSHTRGSGSFHDLFGPYVAYHSPDMNLTGGLWSIWKASFGAEVRDSNQHRHRQKQVREDLH